MTVKLMKTLELRYPMIKFSIMVDIHGDEVKVNIHQCSLNLTWASTVIVLV